MDMNSKDLGGIKCARCSKVIMLKDLKHWVMTFCDCEGGGIGADIICEELDMYKFSGDLEDFIYLDSDGNEEEK